MKTKSTSLQLKFSVMADDAVVEVQSDDCPTENLRSLTVFVCTDLSCSFVTTKPCIT